MRILYVCKPGDEGQADESAIEHALEVLGHRVDRHDEAGPFVPVDADLMLVHKLPTPGEWFRSLPIIREHLPVACWYFDRVRDDDPEMAGRVSQRLRWMSLMAPHLDYLFCTDGDWVDEQNVRWAKGLGRPADWLRQGADERWRQFDPSIVGGRRHKVIFTGNSHGTKRQEFVTWCKRRWGAGFKHYPRGVYRDWLVRQVRRSQVVVAPPTPVTPRYCSNRGYTVMAAGGLLLHPHTASLSGDYPDGGPDWYSSLDQLADRVEYWSNRPDDRARAARHAQEQTWAHNTYRHRLERLLKTVAKGTSRSGTRPSGTSG